MIVKKLFLTVTQTYRLIFHYPDLVLMDTDYNAYWRDKRQKQMGIITDFQRQRADWILPRIEEGSTVLDIGCGDGGILLYMLENKKFTPVAADKSEYALEFVRSKGIATINFDLEKLSDVDKFPEVDYVILFEILEHISSPETLLKLLQPKVRKSIFFSFPNSGYFAYRLRMLFGSFVMQWRLHPGEHLRFWTARDLNWWLKQLGYGDCNSIHIYEGIPFLNRIWGSLFGMAFVGEIKCE